jgi:hypothetical protein
MADRLRLEVAGGGRAVVIVINGRRPFGRAGDRAYRAFHPAGLLDPYLAPLRPAVPARRVAVYQCTCGHAGCGCVAPVISREAERVTWTDFRDFTGCYELPLAGESPDAARGRPLPLPDLSFDAGQYLAEVDRATADRWWETPPMATVRFLSSALRRDEARLAALRWRQRHAGADREPGVFHLWLTDHQDHELCLDLAAQPGTPQQQADELARFVLDTSPLDWPVSYCNLCGGRFRPSPGQSQAQHDAKIASHPAHAPAPHPSR